MFFFSIVNHAHFFLHVDDHRFSSYYTVLDTVALTFNYIYCFVVLFFLAVRVGLTTDG